MSGFVGGRTGLAASNENLSSVGNLVCIYAAMRVSGLFRVGMEDIRKRDHEFQSTSKMFEMEIEAKIRRFEIGNEHSFGKN